MNYNNWRPGLLVENYPNAFYDDDRFEGISRFMVRRLPTTTDAKTIMQKDLNGELSMTEHINFSASNSQDFIIPEDGDVIRLACFLKKSVFYINETRDRKVQVIPYYVSVNSVVKELMESYQLELITLPPGNSTNVID